jgi:hypothetical protein
VALRQTAHWFGQDETSWALARASHVEGRGCVMRRSIY